MTLLKRMAGIGLLLMLPISAHAQSEGWVLSPGSKAGKQSTVVPKNCVTGTDGSITCDTEIVNQPATHRPVRTTTLQRLSRPVKSSLPQDFLTLVDAGECRVARILAMITAVVYYAIVQLVLSRGKLLMGSQATWLGNDLIKVLGDLLTVLIALEVLQNITSYLRRHVVQIELVLVTALTAVARKVIVLPSGAENKPQLLVGLGIAVVSLSAAYWLIKRANASGAFQDPPQSVRTTRRIIS